MAEITFNELNKLILDVPEGMAVPRRIRVGDRLFLEVRRPGTEPARASWVLRYTHLIGADLVDPKKPKRKNHSLGLGRYWPDGPGQVTLKEARLKAKAGLLEIDKGIHPVEARKAQEKDQAEQKAARVAREKRTVRRAVEGWHEATKGKLTSPKYAAQRLRRLEEYLDVIGHISVAALCVADVADAFNKLGARDRAETFRRSSADLEKSIDYAASQGWFDGVNPVARARKGLDKPQQVGRRAFKADRLPEFSKALHSVDAALPYPVTAHLLRMLTLTGARTREIRELQWSEIEGLEGDKPMLHIPASRMKGRKPWSVPLSPQAATLLRDIQAGQAQVGADLKGVKSGFVFTRLDGNYKGRLCSENAVNDLLKNMGWHGELVAHGLRKVFSTVAHASWPYLGANRVEAIEFSLAHVHTNRVRGTYDLNDHMDLRQALMVWWAKHLDTVRQPQASNVVKMRSSHG